MQRELRSELEQVAPELHLPLVLLSQYLFFLTRRPISASNAHYLESRLRGLKSLREPLRAARLPRIETALRQLAALQPASFARVGTDLQLSLLPLAAAAARLPRDLIVVDGPPPADPLRGVRRVLLALGPGIGIGDEIMFFPLPRWLKQGASGQGANEISVKVLSTYSGLWSRVEAADESLVYGEHRELLAALRGEPPYDGFDLVILADFESPELYRAVAWEDRIPRYLEIGLGSRSAFLVDNQERRLNRLIHITPYFENYYFALQQILRGLGWRPRSGDRFEQVVRQAPKPGRDGRLRLFVSPFTSKYDPSTSYWSRLLAGIAGTGTGADGPPLPLDVVFDTGKNATTERTAAGLMRSVRARVPASVGVELACSAGQRTLSLAGVFDQMEAADAVLCADSFAAHAAPLFHCLTLVVAPPQLENWRVPYPGSYYFSTEEPVAEIGLAIRRLLERGCPDLAAQRPPLVTMADRRLDALTGQLEELLEQGTAADAVRLREIYGEFVHAYQSAVASLARRPRELGPLLRDSPYEPVLRGPAASDALAGGGIAPELLVHLRDQLERWQNTNFRKLLRVDRPAPAAAEAPAR